jgi:hypothetical protein
MGTDKRTAISMSVPIQSETVSRHSGGVLQIAGTEPGRPCPIGLTHIAAPSLLERHERAGQSIGRGDLPQIGGTPDAMPQIAGTCLTCDGNGHSTFSRCCDSHLVLLSAFA